MSKKYRTKHVYLTRPIKKSLIILVIIAYIIMQILYNRYQDDWLKTSASSLQLWEKAPFEPYASPKPVRFLNYVAIVFCFFIFCTLLNLGQT